MSDDFLSAELRDRLQQPRSVDDLLSILPALDKLLSIPEATSMATEHLWRAFSDLRQMTIGSPALASKILSGEVLPRCLSAGRSVDSPADRLCSFFDYWLAELPEDHRRETRTLVLREAVSALRSPAASAAINIIWEVGYWDEAVLAALDRLIFSSRDDVGDFALAARVSLRRASNSLLKEMFLDRLHDSMRSGPSWHRLISCRAIGTQHTAGVLWDMWLEDDADETYRQKASSFFAWETLAAIASRIDSARFTKQVWSWLVHLSRRRSDESRMVFSANSIVANQLDFAGVIPELVRLLNRAQGHARLLYYHRILECYRPVSLDGWVDVAPESLESVQRDATAPTGQPGHYSSIEMEVKSRAWEVLLCRGERSVLPSLGDALHGENAYVCSHLLKIMACVSQNVLPVGIVQLISGTFDSQWTVDQKLIAQTGAIEVARASGTREAFVALLGYRQQGDQGILLSVVEAIAETVAVLIDAGDVFPAERLLLSAEGDAPMETRKAAASAVAYLLGMGALARPAVLRAAALMNSPQIDNFAKRNLLYAFASCHPDAIPSDAVGFAQLILSQRGADALEVGERDLYDAAVTLLASRPESSSDPRFLEEHAGLQMAEDGLSVDAQPVDRVLPYVLGKLYSSDPARFAPAAASLLREGNEIQVALLLPWVRGVGSNVPLAVVDALISRLRKADIGWYYDPVLLEVLAFLAPDRLIRDACSSMSQWLSQARSDLADTLGDLGVLPDSIAEARFDLLIRLAGDGAYAVRRAAYRACTKCEPVRFLQLVLSWAQWHERGLQGPRRYAAECAGWIEGAAEAKQLEGLEQDPEPAVRDAYRRSIAERSSRRFALKFEARVLSVGTADGVISNWRNGVALSLVGDDSTLQRLDDRLAQRIPPAVRFWLKRVRMSVERRWGDVTRDWPEPWCTQEGRLERFEGLIHSDVGSGSVVSGLLWLMPAESPTGPYSWGGWARGSFHGTGPGRLIIRGREPASVLITRIDSRIGIRFVGNGEYPR